MIPPITLTPPNTPISLLNSVLLEVSSATFEAAGSECLAVRAGWPIGIGLIPVRFLSSFIMFPPVERCKRKSKTYNRGFMKKEP